MHVCVCACLCVTRLKVHECKHVFIGETELITLELQAESETFKAKRIWSKHTYNIYNIILYSYLFTPTDAFRYNFVVIPLICTHTHTHTVSSANKHSYLAISSHGKKSENLKHSSTLIIKATNILRTNIIYFIIITCTDTIDIAIVHTELCIFICDKY